MVGAARDGVLPLLEDEHAGTLAHDKAVAIGVERAARGGRIGVGGERAAARKAGDGLGDDGGLGAAGEDRVGVAVLDRAEGLADRVGGGGARGHDGQRGAERLVADGDVAGRHVGDHHRDHERGGATRATGGDGVDVVHAGAQAARAGAHVGRPGARGRWRPPRRGRHRPWPRRRQRARTARRDPGARPPACPGAPRRQSP